MRDVFDRPDQIDSIPISLARWEITRLDDQSRELTGKLEEEPGPRGAPR